MGVPASVFELLAPKHEKNGAISLAENFDVL